MLAQRGKSQKLKTFQIQLKVYEQMVLGGELLIEIMYNILRRS
jgi:hypothetical protein